MAGCSEIQSMCSTMDAGEEEARRRGLALSRGLQSRPRSPGAPRTREYLPSSISWGTSYASGSPGAPRLRRAMEQSSRVRRTQWLWRQQEGRPPPHAKGATPLGDTSARSRQRGPACQPVDVQGRGLRTFWHCREVGTTQWSCRCSTVGPGRGRAKPYPIQAAPAALAADLGCGRDRLLPLLVLAVTMSRWRAQLPAEIS